MTRLQRRLLAAVGVALLVVGLALAVSRNRATDDLDLDPGPTAAPPATPGPLPTASESPPLEVDREAVLRDPEAAEVAGAEEVLAAGEEVAAGDWSDLSGPGWSPAERPVYIATAELEDRDRISTDVVVAFRVARATDQVVLRFLPAAEALTEVGGPPTVTVRRDGTAAPHEVDGVGARLLVTLDPPAVAGDAVLLRVDAAYDLVPRQQVLDDGGPAAFGLLAWNPEVSVLGHWLPLLTLPDDSGPMVPWGDVGAFPAAVWSLQVDHGTSRVVTGASDGPCPARVGTEGCTWARGTALRDVSAVAYDEGSDAQRSVDGVLVRSFGPPSIDEARVGLALEETIVGVDVFTDLFGPLAWTEFDVAAVPLSRGAAGMEFPGLVLIREDTYGALGGGFGTYVIAHEVGHQWFHALVGNGSLSDPVVDESLAQYVSVLYFDVVYGQAAAQDLTERYIEGRYRRWRAAGGTEEPPGQPLAEFSGGDAYGPLVYARGALAWLAAEEAIGRDRIVAFLADLVEQFSLESVTDEQVVEEARTFDPRLADLLARYWFDPAPVD